MILEKVKTFMGDHNLIQAGDQVVVAVSGGPDSIALLHMFDRLRQGWNLEICAAHMNHKLRSEADEEEEFVRRLCLDWQIPFFARAVNVRQTAEMESKTLEEAARDCRYCFFEELRTGLGADWIATAHHQDDHAETILMHLLRGSGIRGLRGILPIKGHIIRPLLCINKEEILKYLKANKLEYRLDQSNNDSQFFRNRIRNELLPYLKEYNPSIVSNLNRLGVLVSDEQDFLEKDTEILFKQLVILQGNERAVIDNAGLLKLHPARQRRVLLRVLAELRGDFGWSALDVQMILDLSHKDGSSKKIILGRNIQVHKVYDQLVFCNTSKGRVEFCYPICIPGQIEIAATGEVYSAKIIPREGNIIKNDHIGDEIQLDYDKLEKDLFLRSRKAGDRISIPGMTGRKKVKDYFIDGKIPWQDRDQIPLITGQNQVYAIFGLLVGESARVDHTTRRVLIIRKEEEANNKFKRV